ncbi:HNH endonuclease signature motif containing protein [Microbacterium sp. VKM Ac-2923]|uniref:HNH endonuclease n=1 Tax=Microbacterium sp. VKM Ac-2923 TaxID=2929476 RepID=UPI001FB1AAA1|nr:HNH endonuclease signature motif containing protein [Microbacterium sp. VKM Ac-2923]MCJ1708300.1 HNH endonuclease [Microbacterium sp. VKM Ac-2923]
MHIDMVPAPPPDPPPPAPPRPSRPLTAVLEDVLSAGAALAAAEVARTRALAEAGHLALDVMADQRTTARASELALREVASELAAAENLSDRTAQTQIGRAMTLVDDYPHTLAAWEAAAITRTHVQAILDIGAPLPVEARAEFDLLAVTTADGLSPGRLRSRLAMLAERLHPTTLTERHHRGRDTRCVRIVPGVDGMSDLVATLPTVLAVGIYDRLTQQSRAIIDARGSSPESATDERTTAHLRADILTDLLLTAAPTADPTRTDDGPGTLGTIRARIQVIVPALTMLAPENENTDPAELVGHGPLDADTARTLTETTTLPWDRVITHPVTGAVLHTDTYHRTTAIDRFLRARDRHCRWPGCTTPATRCEVDHTHDHALGGTTTVTNLAHLCQRHHTQKQFTRWKVKQLPAGVLHWTSPTGRTYTDEPLPYSPAARFLPDDPPPPDPDEGTAPF